MTTARGTSRPAEGRSSRELPGLAVIAASIIGAYTYLGYEHTSGGGPNSGAFPLDLARRHVIEIELPALYPAQRDSYFAGFTLLSMVPAKNHATIKVDGTIRIDAPVGSYGSRAEQAGMPGFKGGGDFVTTTPQRVEIGSAADGGGAFSGLTRTVHRLPGTP